VLARRLRRIVHLVLGLCVVIVVVAMLPGRRVYSDANHCLGYALASFGNTEHHQVDCTPSYTTLERTEPAGGWPAIGTALAIAIGAAILYRKPERRIAMLFWLWSALSCASIIALTFQLDLFEHVELLWPAHVIGFALGMLAILVFAAPVVALVTREKPSDSLPVARGSTGSR
jgi:hypothetical protein